jgi:serine/threonine protein kinase
MIGSDKIDLPIIFSLRRWRSTDASDFLEFRLEKKLDNTQPERDLYLANLAMHPPCSHTRSYLVVGTVLQWNPWSTQSLLSGTPVSQSASKSDIQELVKKFHQRGFVHGDLRDTNFISGSDGCVKLVDCDWGGKVSYPMSGSGLTWELDDGRPIGSIEITREDDRRILKKMQNSFSCM